MAESPLFDFPMQPGITCERCGRTFEKGGSATAPDGRKVRLVPHTKGGKDCAPIPKSPVLERDARRRRELRSRL